MLCSTAVFSPWTAHAQAEDSVETLWVEARSHLKRRNYADALQRFNRILEADPNDIWARLYADLCLQNLSQADKIRRLSHEEYAALRERLGAESRPQTAKPAEHTAQITPSGPDDLTVAPAPTATRAPSSGGVDIDAEQLSYLRYHNIAVAEGDVSVRHEDTELRADLIYLHSDTGDLYCQGHVFIEDGNQRFRAEAAHYNLNTKKGRFLDGHAEMPPWYQGGEDVEHLAEGVYRLNSGHLTSCNLDHPHFKFKASEATVFAEDRLAVAKNVVLSANDMPLFYFPRLVFADKHSPFYIIPGKKKPWGFFSLMGYRYRIPGEADQLATFKVDWRENFGWGTGLDYKAGSDEWGDALLKLYYNDKPNRTEPIESLPKGADGERYRLLWRHDWKPIDGMSVITDIQEFSDANFREDLLFREEFVEDDTQGNSFISMVHNTENYTLSSLVRKRMNRFETVTEALPQITVDTRSQRIGDTWLFSESRIDVANFQTVRAHSDHDDDAVRVDWMQQFRYALNWFRPVQVTPRVGVRQTYYNKDGTSSLPEKTDLVSGQFTTGASASIKFFKLMPFATDFMKLNINQLRHILTPSIDYSYTHEPTVPNELLNFAAASAPNNALTMNLENKLQTKRADYEGKEVTVDLVRSNLAVPYTFSGSGNPHGGQLGDWLFDIEAFPWSWMRIDSTLSVPSHFDKSQRDKWIQSWTLDLVMVGGEKYSAYDAPHMAAPSPSGFEVGPQGGIDFMPQGAWFLGIGHRYSQNDKTENVVQFDWRLSDKWQIGTFQRYTWKEVAGDSKRFNNLREHQYSLRRDLHDWVAELVYRIDREYGEEIFFVITLKAYPDLPLEMETSYSQPKAGSQSSPFSPIR